MANWITIKPTPLLEECIETFSWEDSDSILDKAKEIIGCKDVEMTKCWFSLDEGEYEHPLYLICDENFLFAEPVEFNSFATLLYIGPYEMTKEELPRYIAGRVVLCTVMDGVVMELTPRDIEAIKELYKSIIKGKK